MVNLPDSAENCFCNNISSHSTNLSSQHTSPFNLHYIRKQKCFAKYKFVLKIKQWIYTNILGPNINALFMHKRFRLSRLDKHLSLYLRTSLSLM